jgi:hypothetical protein
MSSAETKLRKHIASLENDNANLRVEIQLLRKKLGPAAWRIDANKAEEFIQEIVGGTRTRGSAPYDLRASCGKKLEIKFSNLNRPMANSEMRRWVWAHVLGRNNDKTFDRLILVAPQDPNFREQTQDPESPCVIFDVPFEEVHSISEADGTIWIGTHPTKFRRPTHRRLVCDYQISRKKLQKRYREK